MLLFHVHFEVDDVPAVEAELERDGFAPDEPLDGARLRLSELEQGAVNVVLMPSHFARD